MNVKNILSTVFAISLSLSAMALPPRGNVYTVPSQPESNNNEEGDGEVIEEGIISDEIAVDIQNWEVAILDGKLKMAGLPVTPSVKIYMVKDSVIDLSLRAPFIGEVGRLVVEGDSIIVVNKMNKTYCGGRLPSGGYQLPTANRTSINGARGIGIREVQELLLGNFFLPGIDLENINLIEFVDIYPQEGGFNVVPKGAAEIEGVKYGFVVDASFKPLMAIVLPVSNREMEIDAIYEYGMQGYNLKIVYSEGGKGMEGTLELKNPEWKGSAPKRIDLGNKYRKVSVEEFMRNIGR